MSAQVDILDQLRQLAEQAGMAIVPADDTTPAPAPKAAAKKAAPKAAGKGTVGFVPAGERTSRNGRKYEGRARLTVTVGDALVTVYGNADTDRELADLGARILAAVSSR